MTKKLTTEEFIVKATRIHGDKYDYSKTIYKTAKEKIIIICKKHDAFLQLPYNHLKAQGCNICGIINSGNSRKSNTDEFIKKAKEIHGDKYDYSKVEYKNSNENIKIICKEHGEFEQTPTSHIGGSGCINCGLIVRANKKRSSTDEFIENAKQIHGNKYDYSKVNYTKAIEKVIIICKEHGEFEQAASSHLSGSGCYSCGRIDCANKQRSSTNEFIEKAIIKHGNKYDYSKVDYNKAIEKVIIICKIHGEFLQTPNDHLNLYGCNSCGTIASSNKQRSSTDEFIEKAKEIHGDTYDYSKVDYNNNNTKVIIICTEHGEFLQQPSNHLLGNGCQQCGTIASSNKQRKSLDKFIEQSKEIHEDKYEYSNVEYINDLTKVIIICKKHGKFLQRPNSHLKGSGCPNCKSNYSKQQIVWLNLLSKLNSINIQHAENNGEYTINGKYKADGYCQETNTVYEFHGDYWHGNPKSFKEDSINKTTNKSFGELYQNTLQREQLIKDLGYNLVVMWEYDWNKINNSIKTLQQKFRNSKQN